MVIKMIERNEERLKCKVRLDLSVILFRKFFQLEILGVTLKNLTRVSRDIFVLRGLQLN